MEAAESSFLKNEAPDLFHFARRDVPLYLSTAQVADALNMPFEDSSFDLVWSLESGEHMPDKTKFVQEVKCDTHL